MRRDWNRFEPNFDSVCCEHVPCLWAYWFGLCCSGCSSIMILVVLCF